MTKYIIKLVTANILALALLFTPISMAALASHHHSSEKTEKAKDYGIRVDTKKNKVYVYKKVDGEWVLKDKMKCCTGKDSTPTPKGKHKTGKKEKSFVFEGKNYNYVTYFSGNCAFHSTPESDGKYSDRSLGKNESHGCVRLDPEDAKKIQSLPKGTTVIVE